MNENLDKLDQLIKKLELLTKRQEFISNETKELKDEIYRLKNSFDLGKIQEIEIEKTEVKNEIFEPKVEQIKEIFEAKIPQESITPNPVESKIIGEESKPFNPKSYNPPASKSNLEKFIGENIINKIGIIILIIGVIIGAKYSIEHQLISPLTRIILGYFTGIGLIGFGIKLKKNYENFSAVLVSGAIAILYFITFAAYSFYGLFPQFMAFALMLIFTIFTVIAAINYNRQVIAHIGLVGAYAIPFLLSDGSGKVAVLFSYMAIINIGILILAFKKYWKYLYYAAFAFTWLIFSAWFSNEYVSSKHFSLALTFLPIFFFTFYTIFLAYKLIRKEIFEMQDVIIILLNSFIFYGLGFAILSSNKIGVQTLGLFTLANAILHFGVSSIIYRQKLADKNLFYLIIGLVLVFITIAIPVQLDGNYVTLIWVTEAALLFWLGRTKNISFYETLSYPLMYLAFLSLIHDWMSFYNHYDPSNIKTFITPIFNIQFLSSFVFISAFIFINFWNQKVKIESKSSVQNSLNSIFIYGIPAILIFTAYFAFRLEINNYWSQLYENSALEIKKIADGYPLNYWDEDLLFFKSIWIINYSILFFSILSFINIKKLRNSNLATINLVLNIAVLVLFLTQGLYILSELRDNFLNDTLSQYYNRSSFSIFFRYISYLFVALNLFYIYRYTKEDLLKSSTINLKIPFHFILSISIIWIASSELITYLEMLQFTQSYKLGLSILWGVYSLILVIYGIWKNQKHLRIGAIAFFGITLIKLFIYDISHINTIAKTIVFVSLGILLLIISFLYNKYKHLITDEIEN